MPGAHEVRRLPPIGLEVQMAVFGADVELKVIGVKKLDPVLSAFRKRHAMPDLLLRTICARIAIAGPTGDLKLRPARRQMWVVHLTLFIEPPHFGACGTQTSRRCRGSILGRTLPASPGYLLSGMNAPEGRGRDEDFSPPPAQIPACAANAPGSSLGFWRRSGDMAKDVVS